MSTTLPEHGDRLSDICMSGRAIRTHIAHRGDTPTTGGLSAGVPRTDMQVQRAQAGALWEWWDGLGDLEEGLWRIFIRRRGQIVALQTLKRDYHEARGEDLSVGTLTDEQLVQAIGFLSERLRFSPDMGRLLHVPGCGYVLWH